MRGKIGVDMDYVELAKTYKTPLYAYDLAHITNAFVDSYKSYPAGF